MADASPFPPDIANHILVGINSITRHLETLTAKNAPSTTPVAASKSREEELGHGARRPLSMVIVTNPKPAQSIAHAHLPTLVHLSVLRPSSTTSSSAPTPTVTRLISLATSTDARLASKLHIPRLGALAIVEGAPGANALEEFVREKVGLAECKWIGEALKAEWRGASIKEAIVEVKNIGKNEAKSTKGKASKETESTKV
jgi:ribonuclease P/MRP protein subunit POP3